MKRDFYRLALNSRLFKGRSDWYFCYLKSEKIASVLILLTHRAAPGAVESLRNLVGLASEVVQTTTKVAAGELTEEVLLGELFSMLSKLRLSVIEGHISKETARVLMDEYEALIERVAGEVEHPGLVLSPQDLGVPVVVEEPLFSPLPHLRDAGSIKDIKDISKGHTLQKTPKDGGLQAKGQERASLILDFVRNNKGVSIREISMVVKDCSEKTIQRELNTMIERGVIVRQGERRWSTYHPV